MLRSLSAAAAGALALAAAALPAAAAGLFDGKTVQITYLYPDGSTALDGPDDITGGGASVAWNIGSPMTVTLSGNTLTASDVCGPPCSFGVMPVNGLRLSDIYGVLPDFTAVTVNAATNFPAFDSSRITFDANTIFLSFSGLSFSANPGVLAVDVAAAGSGAPEPAAWALMIAGFGLAGGTLRRRAAARA